MTTGFSLGFTGSRKGLYKKQLASLEEAIGAIPATSELHHGDCVEGDAIFHRFMQCYAPWAHMHIHPPESPKFRAYCIWNGQFTLHPEKKYHDRNEDIANASSVLLACPRSMTWKQGYGGTRYTADYAIKIGIPTIVILPTGAREFYNGSEWYIKGGYATNSDRYQASIKSES